MFSKLKLMATEMYYDFDYKFKLIDFEMQEVLSQETVSFKDLVELAKYMQLILKA